MRAVGRTEAIDSLLELKSLFHFGEQHNNPEAVSNNDDYKLK